LEEFNSYFSFSITDWSPTLQVLFYATLTAIATGLGALPFLFIKRLSERLTHFADAIAAGLMLIASIQLVNEGRAEGLSLTIFGIVFGCILLVLIKKNIDFDFADTWKGMDRGDVSKIFLILGVMTLHSFAEGVGVGVSFARSDSLGMYISSAIALHNIPEGIAISIVLVSRGVSVWKSALWAIFTSLPQPLLAVPSFLLVEVFEPFLPIGMGLAAGAMVWICFSELLPEPFRNQKTIHVIAAMLFGMLLMLGLQLLL
jgi:zinc transporter ZupT